MVARRSRSFRASELEMGKIQRAALVVGLGPATLVRKAALATASRILDATETADSEVIFAAETEGGQEHER